VLVIPRNVTNLVYLLGGVSHPDAYPIRPGDRILDLLVRGGSPVPNANLSKVMLTRQAPGGGRTARRLDLKELQKSGDSQLARMEVMPGDVIFVPVAKPKQTLSDKLTPIFLMLSLVTQLQS